MCALIVYFCSIQCDVSFVLLFILLLWSHGIYFRATLAMCVLCYAGWLLRGLQHSWLFHRSTVEIMLVGVHTRASEGRQTRVEVIGAILADWSRDQTVWVVSYVWILSSIPVRMPGCICLCNCPAGCLWVRHCNIPSTSTILLIEFLYVLTHVVSKWDCLGTNHVFAPVTTGGDVAGI